MNEATELADKMLAQEAILIKKLVLIDQQKYFVRYGYRSLSGFCKDGLKLSRTQTQRIVTHVRRYEPTVNIVVEAESQLIGAHEITD
ncbi:MAG: hypothetical protein H7256_13765 [Bdellovibrio sp.]|nr:hypothetical protein [Bdellovibrio sp.]